ncbi:MAG: sigma-70 family RNA polymerase sigma factor, partial [Acidimicrobiia bacterium]|nr:sigma-70 family RNA polymerase sigma factor [Acidimicrobiia bacterium]
MDVDDRTGTERDPSWPLVSRPTTFDDFFRDEFRRVLTLVSVLSGSLLAEDLAQEAFTRAYKSWDKVGVMERPDAWVRVVAMNLARSALRRTKAEARAVLRLGRPATTLPPMEPESDLFWKQVRRLPSRQAQVIALHYLEDRQISEIAAILAISENTVKVQLRNGRQNLASRLGVEDRHEF